MFDYFYLSFSFDLKKKFEHAILKTYPFRTRCPQKNGTQGNGYLTASIFENPLSFPERNGKLLNDIHTKNQVYRLNVDVT